MKRTPHPQGLDQVFDGATSERPDPNLLQTLKVPVVQMRVLCATDLSSRSHYAVSRATLLANRLEPASTATRHAAGSEG